jgi:hypothetical protein
MIDLDYNKSKVKRKILLDAACCYAQHLFSETENAKLKISIDTVYNLIDKRGIIGECNQDTKYQYTITLDSKMNLLGMLTIMAHEMVHVSQYVKGKLIDERPGVVVWDGTEYDVSEIEVKNYNFLPWEVEANGLANGLIEYFLNHHNLINKKWVFNECYIKVQ